MCNALLLAVWFQLTTGKPVADGLFPTATVPMAEI